MPSNSNQVSACICITYYSFLVQANCKYVAPPVQRIIRGKGYICPTLWPQRHLHTHIVGYCALTSTGAPYQIMCATHPECAQADLFAEE